MSSDEEQIGKGDANLLHGLRSNLLKIAPKSLKSRLRGWVSTARYDLEKRKLENPYRGVRQKDFQGSEVVLGIIEDTSQYHRHYIAACEEMNISFLISKATTRRYTC